MQDINHKEIKESKYSDRCAALIRVLMAGANMHSNKEKTLTVIDVLVTACLTQTAVSKQQMMTLFNSSKDAVTKNLCRGSDMGLIRRTGREHVSSKCMYCLTPKGVEYARGMLLPLFPSEAANINRTCDSYVVPATLSADSHKVLANDLFFFVCSHTGSPVFSFSKECIVNPASYDEPVRGIRSEDGSVSRRKGDTVCDGYMEYMADYPYEDACYAQSIYVEQDMCTQNLSIISAKVEKYLSLLSERPDLPTSEILFMIHARNTERVMTRESPIFAPVEKAAYLTRFLICAARFYNERLNPSAQDIYEILTDHYEQGIKVFGSAVDTLLNLLEGMKPDDRRQTPADFCIVRRREKVHSLRPFYSRRNAIMRAVLELPSAEPCFCAGLDIFFACNEDMDNYDWLHLYLNNGLLSLARKLLRNDTLEYYTGCVIHGIHYPYSLLPRKTAPGAGFPVVVENISDSLGGVVRARKFLELTALYGDDSRIILLCATRKDATDFIEKNTAAAQRAYFVFYRDEDGEKVYSPVKDEKSSLWAFLEV